MDKKELLELIKNHTDKISGGKGDKLDPNSVDEKQLMIGILVELEHTNNKQISMDIALDHLEEHDNYYTVLIESGLVDEKPAIDLFNKFYNKNISIDESILRNFIKNIIIQEKSKVTKAQYKKYYEKHHCTKEDKKYRVELNRYNHEHDTYGNSDKKDATHINGKIKGFEEEKKNRERKKNLPSKQDNKK